MCVLCLRRILKIDGCASNTLRAKDPQHIDHLVLVVAGFLFNVIEESQGNAQDGKCATAA
jgi:hypothetical protein